MTKRELFALESMKAMLSGDAKPFIDPSLPINEAARHFYAKYAQEAVLAADALLTELEK